MPVIGEVLHHQKDERCLARQTECLQIKSQRLINTHIGKIERFHKHFQNFTFNIFLFANEFANHFFVQTGIFAQKMGDFERIEYCVENGVFLEELYALFGALIEEVRALRQQLMRRERERFTKNERVHFYNLTYPFFILQLHQLLMIDWLHFIVVTRHTNKSIIQVGGGW
jgi:hypothetical protein